MYSYLIQAKKFQINASVGLECIRLLLFSMLIFPTVLYSNEEKLYSLARVGGLIISSDSIENIQIVGLVIGLRVENALYLETELNTSVSGGEYLSIRGKGRLNISNFNLYGVYRYVFNKRFYGKLKAGMSYNSLEYNISSGIEFDSTESGYSTAAGIGIGVVYIVSTNPVMLELEFSIIDNDIKMFTLGMTSPF